MIEIIDSHCHLADARLRDDVVGAIARARAAGVTRMISVGAIGPIDNDRLTVEIAERHQGVFASVGVHPHDARDASPERLAALRELARSPRVVAIGESGLDYHYTHSPRQVQAESLRAHLALACELNKPIVIHCRDAESDVAEIVRSAGMPPAGGVIHCFTGNAHWAREFVAMGFHISFSGILTFRNAAEVRAAAPVVPADRLMVETDAPYLAPVPMRGKRNEPAFVVHTLDVLAMLRGDERDALARTTAANTCRLFGLPKNGGDHPSG